MKHAIRIAAAGAAVALAPMIAEAKTLTYGTYLSARHATNVASVIPWMRAVEKDTGGSLTFELAADGTLVSGRDSLQGIRDGLIDMSTIVDFYTPNDLKTSTILTELAMLGSDAAVMTAAINEMQLLNCPSCLKEGEDNNLKIMAVYASSPYHLICNKPFETLESLKGARIRATGAWAVFATSIGATPVNITSGEQYEALQRGQVDCTLINVPALTNYSLYEVAKYVVDLPIGTFHGAHVFNLNSSVWEGLSDEEKKAFIGNIPQAMANLTEGAIAEDAHARKVATDAGVVFAEPDPALVKALETFKHDELKRIGELAGSRGVEEPEALFAKFQELITKWDGVMTQTGDDWSKYATALKTEIYDKID
ncbi:C4-dicarboxylate TRAP transporter substrate-binding protein [Aquamicrobium sp. LC103]|uniref:C4-dicarboxylate TRAP transporter substrate-binding protein n=1 Tax=Aquamicrobium sp. LC103 TaxID=1120658 RepID=UPI000B02A9AE|nr:C4-dicarboxylate TRAP transporter substrate-binding protein [Aquamicrobium sp. LC103]